MGKWNRSPLPPGEDDRIETQVTKIHSALKEGPKTNKHLSHSALDYSRPIRELRNKGQIIDCERIKEGLFRYTLIDKQEPEWIQGGEVTLPDGTYFRFAIKVNAKDRGQARNRAQHLFAKVKLLMTVPINPWLSPEEADDLLLKIQSQLDKDEDQ
jgi:hypothetical protein